MAREEFDESLYRRPEKKDAGEGEEENKKTEDLPKNDAAPIGDDPADEWKRRSAWDDDEEDEEKPEQPRSRRKFMPDDDEEPPEGDGRKPAEKPAEKPAGKGEGNVAFIVKDFLAGGGTCMTIEPHLKVFGGLKALERAGVETKMSTFAYETNDQAFDAACAALRGILVE